MKSMISQFEGLADRDGFNASVRHIQTVVASVDRLADKENLADIIGELLEDKKLDKDDIRPVVSMILGQKYPYRSVSANLDTVASELGTVSDETASWNGVDLVAIYFHPDLGALIVNPKNKQRMAQIDRLNRSELVVVYAGRFTKEGDPAVLEAAARAVIDLFAGRKPKVKPEFLKGDCAYRQPKSPAAAAEARPRAKPKAKAAVSAAKAPPKAKKAAEQPAAAEPEEPKAAVAAEQAVKPGARMTPMYSVNVTNELFHNGNVEAWKRIIASYNAKHPDLQVLVYYDGERITNLNALFKWGKVKHGSSIQFAIAGENISDVAKLQRYLAQGASHMFEAFLRGPVNSVMALF
ncbi:MAG TPA: hypothetical protein VMV90_09925 [Rectinemataceae bacterium]|nr:hypothetical protein [Rectinemataceae bacterium]